MPHVNLGRSVRRGRMAGRWASVLLCGTGVVLAGLAGGCGRSAEAGDSGSRVRAVSASGSEPVPGGDTYSMFLEEGMPAFFVELSRTEMFMFEAYSTIRLVPWRRVSRDGREAFVRLSLGYGTGLGQEARRAARHDRDSAAGLEFIGAMMSNFEERLYFQLTPEEARRVLRLVDELAELTFGAAGAGTDYRFVQLESGDFVFRRTDAGLFIWMPGDPGGWEPLPAARFRQGIERAIADLGRLESSEPSVRVAR